MKVMQLKINWIILFFALSLSFSGFSQTKGKAKHLIGVWEYSAGSGYEIWTDAGTHLIGQGFRSNKFGDSILVEEIRLELINKTLIYKMETQNFISGDLNIIKRYTFISTRKKLDFVNTTNEMPYELIYKFGFFNKKKLRIEIYNSKSAKPIVLRLRKK
jgi:hypothetical protein